jgi:ElaB/YqjD/DUF883 family membrane-anchored ribosome-binding protein
MNADINTMKNKRNEAAEVAQDTISAATKMAKSTARHVAADVSSYAESAATTVRDAAVEQIDKARDALGESGDRLAETLRRAAEQPAEGSVQARVLSAVAGGVSSAAETLRDRSVSEIAADVRGLARRNPAVFAAGAAVAGFMLARFLRASVRTRADGDRS